MLRCIPASSTFTPEKPQFCFVRHPRLIDSVYDHIGIHYCLPLRRGRAMDLHQRSMQQLGMIPLTDFPISANHCSVGSMGSCGCIRYHHGNCPVFRCNIFGSRAATRHGQESDRHMCLWPSASVSRISTPTEANN
jgi:hypothetical protein